MGWCGRDSRRTGRDRARLRERTDRVGLCRPLPDREGDSRRHRQHHGDGGAGDGARHRFGRRRRDHAALAQSGAEVGRRRLYLAVPRHAADPATLVVVQPRAVFSTNRHSGLLSVPAGERLDPLLSALLGLGINQGAYTSEVMRAGMLSVDAGQYEAAQAIGMGRLHALRRIILPQAMRVVIPPLGNEFIGMVKATSLASVIQYPEVLHNAENIYYANSRVIELLIVAGFWYLLVVSILTPLQMLLERRFARGALQIAR